MIKYNLAPLNLNNHYTLYILYVQRPLAIQILELSSNCTSKPLLVFPDQKNSVWRFSNYELEKGLSKWTGELKCFVAWQLTIPTAALLLLPVNLHVGICWVGRCYQNWRLLLLQNDQIFIIYFPKKHWRQASKWHFISLADGGAIFGWLDSWKKCSQEHKLAILHPLNPRFAKLFQVVLNLIIYFKDLMIIMK